MFPASIIPGVIFTVLPLAGSGGLGGIAPLLLPDVPISSVVLFALLNPATIAVAYLMGRRADQWPKIVIAAFAGALAGAVLLWLGTLLRLSILATPARAAAGIFVTGFVFALIWAAIGYRHRQRQTT